MAKVFSIVCDNCGVTLTDANNSNGYIRIVYPNTEDKALFKAEETNDLCSDCFGNALNAVHKVLKPEALTVHKDATLAFIE